MPDPSPKDREAAIERFGCDPAEDVHGEGCYVFTHDDSRRGCEEFASLLSAARREGAIGVVARVLASDGDNGTGYCEECLCSSCERRQQNALRANAEGGR